MFGMESVYSARCWMQILFTSLTAPSWGKFCTGWLSPQPSLTYTSSQPSTKYIRRQVWALQWSCLESLCLGSRWVSLCSSLWYKALGCWDGKRWPALSLGKKLQHNWRAGPCLLGVFLGRTLIQALFLHPWAELDHLLYSLFPSNLLLLSMSHMYLLCWFLWLLSPTLPPSECLFPCPS